MRRLIKIMTSLFLAFLLPTTALCVKAKNIAVIHKGSYLDFWDLMYRGVQQGATQFGVNVDWVGADYSDNSQSQIKWIRQFVEKSVDAIILIPADKSYPVDVVRQAAASGIKVIVVDSALEGEHHLSYIGSNNYLSGITAARHLAKQIGDVGKVALIRSVEKSASTDERGDGFLFEMSRSHRGIKVVADLYGGGLVGSTYRAVQQILTQQPDIKGIFSVNESSSLGTLRALKEVHKEEEITFIGFDFNEELHKALIKGDIGGLMIQEPMKMGYLGVQAAVHAIDGKAIKKNNYTDTYFVQKDDLNNPKVQALLFP